MKTIVTFVIALLIMTVFFYFLDYSLMKMQGLDIGANLFPIEK